MKVNGKMEKNMDKDYSNVKMEILIRDHIKMEKNMDLEFYNYIVEIIMKVNNNLIYFYI